MGAARLLQRCAESAPRFRHYQLGEDSREIMYRHELMVLGFEVCRAGGAWSEGRALPLICVRSVERVEGKEF